MTPSVPNVGQVLTVDLPGERIRVTVGEIVDPDHFRAKIDMAPLGKSGHKYKLNDVVLFRRTSGQIGDTWEAVDEDRMLLDRLKKVADLNNVWSS